LNEKELSKYSFWKSAEEYESKGFSFCGFLQKSERVKQEKELNAGTSPLPSALRVSSAGPSELRVNRTRILIGCLEGRGKAVDGWGWCELNI
jgi:hypothetical protein